MAAKDKLYSGTELAQEFALTPQALRFYEEKGLLQPARSGRMRVYTYRDRARLLLIQRLRRLGFSLEDCVQYLSLYGSVGGGQYQLGLEKIERRVTELLRLRGEIDQTIDELKSLEQEARQKLAAADERASSKGQKHSKGTEEPA
ncbi:MAG: MerR family transcriptional regulator [Magnetospirillum sp.]